MIKKSAIWRQDETHGSGVSFPLFHHSLIFKGRKGGRSVLKERSCHVPAALCQWPWQVTTLFPWTGSIVKRTKQRLGRMWPAESLGHGRDGAWNTSLRCLSHSLPVIKCPNFSSMPNTHTHTPGFWGNWGICLGWNNHRFAKPEHTGPGI